MLLRNIKMDTKGNSLKNRKRVVASCKYEVVFMWVEALGLFAFGASFVELHDNFSCGHTY